MPERPNNSETTNSHYPLSIYGYLKGKLEANNCLGTKDFSCIVNLRITKKG